MEFQRFLLKHQQNKKHDRNIFAISIVNDLSFCKFVILSIIEGKSEMRRYKFENSLIAILINRQQYCLSIADGKSEMRGYKFEYLLMAFLITSQQYCLSIKERKK